MILKQSEPEIKAVVCAVRGDYEICVLTDHESLVSVRVGDDTYYYADNGVRHSRCPLHKFRVPSEKLNAGARSTGSPQSTQALYSGVCLASCTIGR